MKQKDCDSCKMLHSVMYRVQKQKGKTWIFVCPDCLVCQRCKNYPNIATEALGKELDIRSLKIGNLRFFRTMYPLICCFYMETLEKHILKYGIFTTIGLIAFFFLMKLLGLVNIIELRALNGVIMFAGVFMAIKKFRSTKMNLNFNYLSGIGTGFAVGLMTATLFSIFITAYLFFDKSLMQIIIAEQSQMLFVHQLTIGMVIFVEAMASGFLFSYVSMQWLKEDETVPLSHAAKA